MELSSCLSPWKKLSTLLALALSLLAPVFLTQCASDSASSVAAAPVSPGGAGSASRYAADDRAAAKLALADRPGVGTTLGSEIHDSSTTTSFLRKSSGIPDGVGTFHYNDQEGARLMAEMFGRATRHGGDFELIPGRLRVTVVGRYGEGAFEHYTAGEKVFVIATPGSGYELKLENLTKQRLEVVVSVDGLNVLDGQPASVKKPGYVIGARSSIMIEGMKVGGKMHSLQFSTVAKSQAATAFGEKGARNVGVIGAACYEEDETARRRIRVAENYMRGDAQAFR